MAWTGVPVIEIGAGRHGVWGLKNTGRFPTGALVQLRNATLEDYTWRAGGGATLLGSAIGGTPTHQAAIDYWPAGATQRTLASLSDGTLRKDNGAGGAWVTLLSGLTTTGQVAGWVIGGAEATGRNRKAFHFDRINAVQVLSGDGATMAAIASPPGSWAGANQPGLLVVHQGYLWGDGGTNDPHRMHRSLNSNHEDFLTTPYSLLLGPERGEERISAGLSYKGGLLLWKYPRNVYFVDTSDPTPANWQVKRVGTAGASGPGCIAAAEDDVVWVAPDGSWHLISATQVTGSVRAEDLTARKLGAFFRDSFNLAQLATGQMVYYSHKLEVMLALAGQGTTAKNRRMHLSLNQKGEVGENWIYWDRDRNEALFLRKKSEIDIPAMGDAVGQLWELDQTNRNANGAGYAFEWWTADMDFSQAVPGWAGRYKNLRFLQIEYVPRVAATHTIEVYHDGVLRQTINFSLSGGSTTLPQTLPFTFGGEGLALTRPTRLLGRARRVAFRGRSSALNADVSIAKLLVGVELGE